MPLKLLWLLREFRPVYLKGLHLDTLRDLEVVLHKVYHEVRRARRERRRLLDQPANGEPSNDRPR